MKEKLLSKGFSKGRSIDPWIIVIHYTAGYTEDQCYNTLAKLSLSTHLTIERNGDVFRYVKDLDRAWHTGKSSWCNVSNINNHSLGIESVNFGWCDGLFLPQYLNNISVYRNKSQNPEIYPSPFEFYRDESSINQNNKKIITRVITSQLASSYPDHRFNYKGKLWCNYPDEQIESICIESLNWSLKYNIIPENIIGHEHISPNRKADPGPAFPWRTLNKFLIKNLKEKSSNLIDPNYKKELRIKSLQSHCKRLSLPVGNIDGIWGNKTKKAVELGIKKYKNFYSFEKIKIEEENVINLSLLFKEIPG